nr:tannase/feruloyl esterase family alpha/beta hydrolase [Burkholderia ubonensis]
MINIMPASTAVAIVVCTALAACGGDESSPVETCSSLLNLTVPASAIGLPTRGARITDAKTVVASGSGADAIPEYCEVSANIAPVSPSAPPISFKLELPRMWNRKIMMLGGGGYDGSISLSLQAGLSKRPSPLERGYAVFASDSGHVGTSKDGSFGLNDEALRNFAGDALKKTRDAAVYLIDRHYAVSRPEKAYFVGGSSGGREALEVAQRWPEDWSGIIALYPAWNAASLNLQLGRITRAFAKPGAYLNSMKRKALLDAAMAACDGLDGIEDGIISNVPACNAVFDPAVAMLNGKPLRCAGGADTGGTCLSDAQIAALKVYSTPINFNFSLSSGETQYPGFNVYGANLGIPGNSVVLPSITDTIASLALGNAQPASPMPSNAPYLSVFWDQWIQYFVTRKPGYNSLSVDPENPGVWQSRISELSMLQDQNKVDLSSFAVKGGKILMAHGTADVLVSTRSTEQYYERVQRAMGVARVHDFLRYYEIPGYGHGYATVFNAEWDAVTTLENWVEKGIDPSSQVVADTVGVRGRTRPLCEYPTWPKYVGSGDVNAASSFICVDR